MSTNYYYYILLVIIQTIKNHLGAESSISIQPIIEDFKYIIAHSRDFHKDFNDAKAVWKKRILDCGNLIGVSISCKEMNWELVEDEFQEASKPSPRTKLSLCKKSNTSKLKTVFSETDKQIYKETFDAMVKNHKDKFWVLKSTEKEAAENNTCPKSVEEKVFELGYAVPIHSLT
ncbi:hypothetical protein BDC45DRAFT_26704 [Circinella umbellata]|nr:hypothetical protein BDC45DRAFT_26704 [Circinella umbellata]